MLRHTVLAATLVAVGGGTLSAGQGAAPQTATAPKISATAPPVYTYTEVARLTESTRRTIFSEVARCRAEVTRKADELYPELKIQSPGYNVKEDVRRFKDRGRFEDAGLRQCSQQVLTARALEPRELSSILLEGVSRKWPTADDPRSR